MKIWLLICAALASPSAFGVGKNVIAPVSIVSAGDMSGSVTSSSVNVQYFDNIGVSCAWTGTAPTGTFAVDTALDPTGIAWTALTLSPVPAASGANGNFFLDINQTGAVLLRLRYVRVSGTGTLNCKLDAKAL